MHVRPSHLLVLLAYNLAACNNGTGSKPPPIVDTNVPGDSDPTDDSVPTGDSDSPTLPTDSDSPDDTDSGIIESQTDDSDSTVIDDSDPPPDDESALDLYPGSMVVHPGATWTLRAVATDPDGVRADASGVSYAVDDGTIVSVDASGLVTALAEGSTEIRATYGALTSISRVEVRNDGVMTVTVTDNDGAPIPFARVGRRDTDYVETDAAGVALWPVDSAGPETVTAWLDGDWSSTTVADTVSRRLTLRLLPKDWEDWGSEVEGSVGFGSVPDANFGEVVAGIAGASIGSSLTAFEIDQIFSEDREFNFYGIDVSAPANLFIEGAEETYVTDSEPGDVAAWAMAGPLAISDLSAGFSGSGEAIALLTNNLNNMTWGYTGGGSVGVGGSTTLNVAPDSAFSDSTSVTVPTLSAGFNGAESLLLIAVEEAPDGYLISGFGSGAGGDVVSVQHVGAGAVPSSTGTSILAFAQIGGLGTGDGSCATAGEVIGGSVVFPPLMDVGTVSWLEREITYTVDSDADFVHVRLEDGHGHIQDVYTAGSWSGRVPDVVERFADGDLTIKVLAADSTRGNFEDQVSSGALSVDSLIPDTTCRAVYR